ncbi:MAG: thiolase C-terminal domain-containing protein [Thermoplasmata archaeon]
MNCHVAASGWTRFGRRSEGLLELASEAGRAALEGVGRDPIDLLVVGQMLSGEGEGVSHLVAHLAERLGLGPAAGWRVDAASASGAAAFHSAVLAVASGRYERALVIGAEKMTHLSTPEVTRRLATSLAPMEQSVGATMPGLAALVAQRYLERYPNARPALAEVTVRARENAVRNPFAQFPSPVTRLAVEQSRWVAPPLRLLHCAAISDGAAAVVLERGRGPATVVGIGQAFSPPALADRPDSTCFAATREAARQAFESARCSRDEIQVAEIHDAFAPFALINLEDLGFAEPGLGARFFGSPSSAPAPSLSLNPSGGLLGRGHPVGASGLAQIAEISAQLRGDAGPTQIPGHPRRGLAQSIGGLGAQNLVTILGAEETP